MTKETGGSAGQQCAAAEPINWQLSYELFKGQYALTCDRDFPISMKISEETFSAMKEALRLQAFPSPAISDEQRRAALEAFEYAMSCIVKSREQKYPFQDAALHAAFCLKEHEDTLRTLIQAPSVDRDVVDLIQGMSANIQVLMNVIKDPDGGSEMAKMMILMTADNTVSEAKETLSKLRGVK